MGSIKGAVGKKAICGLGEADFLLAFSKRKRWETADMKKCRSWSSHKVCCFNLQWKKRHEHYWKVGQRNENICAVLIKSHFSKSYVKWPVQTSPSDKTKNSPSPTQGWFCPNNSQLLSGRGGVGVCLRAHFPPEVHWFFSMLLILNCSGRTHLLTPLGCRCCRCRALQGAIQEYFYLDSHNVKCSWRADSQTWSCIAPCNCRCKNMSRNLDLLQTWLVECNDYFLSLILEAVGWEP